MNIKDTFNQPPTETFSIYDAGVLSIKPDTSTPLKKAIVELEDEIRNDQQETAAAFDEQGLLLFRKQGNTDDVQLNDEYLKLLFGATLTHNHPNGTTFSVQDMFMAERYSLRELRAVTPILRYSISAKFYWPSVIAIEAYVERIKLKVNQRILSMVKTGEINPKFAEAEYLHYILVMIAYEFNLSYTREKS